MPNFHVTVAVEANEEAGHILRTAAHVAQERNADLTVVSVIPPFFSVYADVAYMPTLSDGRSIEESARDERIETLSQVILKECPGAELRVPVGIPAQEIAQLADVYNSQLVVMGLHNRRGIGRLLGSTTQAVLNLTRRELLAVRPVESASYGYDSVVIGVDSSSAASSVLEAASDYAKNANWMRIATIVPPINTFYGPASVAAPDCWPFPAAQEDLQKAVTTQVAAMAQAHGLDPAKVVTKTGYPAEALCQLAEAADADLIIVGVNAQSLAQRLFLGSTSRRVLNIAPCDVLVTRAAAG